MKPREDLRDRIIRAYSAIFSSFVAIMGRSPVPLHDRYRECPMLAWISVGLSLFSFSDPLEYISKP
ncbi:MAG: hypothetical protein KAH57_08260 [Thermoplasmata archaeon]|nr:hypothetical protein [Thermoplasmata archaeon]